MSSASPRSAGGPRVALWWAIGAITFVIGYLALFHGMLGASPSESVPVNVARGIDERRAYPTGILAETDHRFVVWQSTRNAYTLLGSPWRLFQAEPCHPTEDVLALGEPGIAMGVLGIPGWIVTGDPIATYNSVLALVTLISFVSMFLLVREWTGVPAAAVVAALLFAFHEVRLKDPVHFYVWDNSWTVLALYFTTRLFTRTRFVDALGLAGVIAMQLVGSLYPLLAGVFVAAPVLVWLGLRHGVRQLRPSHWLFVVVCMLGVAVPLFAPYLEQSDAGMLPERAYQVFFDLDWLRPGGPAFPGWATIALVLAAFAVPRRYGLGERGDPRIALLVIGVLLLSISVGGNTVARLEAMQRGEPLPPEFPNLYDLLAVIVPGLRQVRGPGSLYSGVHMALCILAGVGAAGLIRLAGSRGVGVMPERLGALVSGLLIFLALVEVARPAALGLDPRIQYVPYAMRPPEQELVFLERIAELDGAGPVLELPFNPKDLDQASRAVLLAAYHRRRTSQCFNSYHPPEVARVKAVSDRLPSERALRELDEMGFTTILIHPEPAPGVPKARRRWRQEFEAARSSPGLRLIAEDGERSAWAIVVSRSPAGALHTED